MPIIPMVLVNGADGIGTGWSTKVPNYNPRYDNICLYIRNLEYLLLTTYTITIVKSLPANTRNPTGYCVQKYEYLNSLSLLHFLFCSYRIMYFRNRCRWQIKSSKLTSPCTFILAYSLLKFLLKFRIGTYLWKDFYNFLIPGLE